MALVAGAITVVPFAWVVISSFKPRSDIFSRGNVWFPKALTLDNYRTVFESPILDYAANSLVATAVALLIALPAGALAAFAFSRYRFRGRGTLLVLLLITQLLPAIALVVPLFRQLSSLGLINNTPVLGLIYGGLMMPVVILLMVGFIDAIPTQMDEAALVDGATEFQLFRKVVFPLVRPGLAAGAVLVVIATWQEFLLAVSLTTTRAAYTLPVGLATFQTERTTDWGAIMAMSVAIAVPAIITFWVLQRHFVNSLVGAVKG